MTTRFTAPAPRVRSSLRGAPSQPPLLVALPLHAVRQARIPAHVSSAAPPPFPPILCPCLAPQARILVHGKVTHLGYYETEEEAARVYDK